MNDIMDYKRVYAIALKDLKEAFSSIEVYGPMLGLPLFFSVFLPFFTVYVSQYASTQLASRIFGISSISTPENAKFLFIQYFAINILGPIFLSMPIITTSVLAADSFAGEKERKTAEALLTSPITSTELFLGKILASFVPTFIVTIAIFIIYASIINYYTLSLYSKILFPNTMWYLMLLNAPFLIGLTIGIVVVISSKVKGIKEAQQISALIALPILIMPFSIIFNIFKFDTVFLILLALSLFILDILIFYIGVKTFKKESLISI